ncbi:MAG: hypothetical protein QOA13_00530 [Nitrososphaeraceae archaeon]|nr:hypothetical protein [Nitrososphaeraceae archaeon]MDW0252567.1 hypothetical protein [Nitrososphaeraceae archaeon]MDW0286359.1 hypothetical protein [Nitrososphaeraceae archaeon]MDW0296520.1 hypothetical protein [Nitrososphaeraceae archaeon]MDW0327600.1 hypothetical protein [Nitrososphaeraceae archaeon]
MKILDASSVLDRILSRRYEMNITIAILIIGTAGSFLQIGGTSWDITSHIMQEPETFFTPSHTVLYTGVGLLTIAAGLSGVMLLRNNDELRKKSFVTAFKLLIIGSAVSLVAGPSDFLWHETFGVDGLLSPSHLALITGMLINAVAVAVGLARITVHISAPSKQRLIKLLMIPGFAALWVTCTWYVYMFSLPFSNGENFQFNLNPNIAAIIAIIVLPLLSSIIFVTASKTIGRFGAASAVAGLVLGVNVLANIIPTDGMITSSLPWYLIFAIIPAVAADIILNNATIRSKIGVRESEVIAGAIISSTFYVFGYPMLTWAFAIPLDMQLGNLQGIEAVAMLTSNFLSTLPTVLAITLVPGALMGMVGAYLSSKKIAIPSSSSLTIRSYPRFLSQEER